ncbi:phosphoenolpyruvate carboxylase [Archangium lansingense]|uniref:phosphoenolpyruvate carboxylase n=1 Tax=Archangium lansingense TaxID=2995310 RepID=UPI003B79DFEC
MDARGFLGQLSALLFSAACRAGSRHSNSLTPFRTLSETPFRRHSNSLTPFRGHPFGVSTTILSTGAEVMEAYAGLVEDAAIREQVMGMIREEYARTRRMLEAIWGAPLEERRPHIHRALSLRQPWLRVLHRQQIELLRTWRAQRKADGQADHLLPRLLLTVNAIAGGLRTTG